MSDEKKSYRRQPSVDMKRKWLDLFYQQKVSVKSIADEYGYPVYTVYRVLNKMTEAKQARSDKGRKRASPVIDIDMGVLSLQGESHETQLEMFIGELMRAIGQNRKIKVSQALVYVNQLTNAFRRLRSVQIRQLAKDFDVKLVERIIRRYEPTATDLRVIEICKEEIAKQKSEAA